MPKKETQQLVPVISSFTELELTGTPTGGGDAAIGQKLTELYSDAQAAELAILRFGAAFWAVEQGIKTTRGFNSPKAGVGSYGFKNWLADHAPEVALTTAQRYRDIAEACAMKFQIADPVRVFSLPASELDAADQDKRAAVVDFIANKSMRGLQMELGLMKHLEKRRIADEKTVTPVSTAEQLEFQTAEEVSGAIERIEGLLLKQNVLTHMSRRPEFIRGVVESLNLIASKVEKATKPLLAAA